jgi:hypothetical protein
VTESLHRDLGRVEGKVDAQQRTIDDMQRKVDEMHRALMQAAGGWKVLMLVGTASAAVGAFVTKLVGIFWR